MRTTPILKCHRPLFCTSAMIDRCAAEHYRVILPAATMANQRYNSRDLILSPFHSARLAFRDIRRQVQEENCEEATKSTHYMPALADDYLTRLSFSIYENRGVYALMIGSGLSRAAEIPTGWEITLDLIRRVAMVQGEDQQTDWAAWYRETKGKDPMYSELVAELGQTREERRSILHSYIEPSAEDREEGRKLPTAAHYAIADLVQAGYVRVIITTNFDRLLENALRERGVEPTVVASVDALKGAEPLSHTNCYLLKLHGDYKDARILNTDEELSGYPTEIDALLDRIFDEHGLIVCGWSGEWDHALRAAIIRSPARRYSMFWAALGPQGDGVTELIAHRDGRLVPITDADSFFIKVRDHIATLAQTHSQNPQSVELLVNSTKRYLAKPEYRIQLDELLTSEAHSLLDKLVSADLTTQGNWSAEEFQRRVAIYEATAEPLARMVGVLGRWGDDSEFMIIIDIVSSILSHAAQERSGHTLWLNLRSYPAVLIVAAYGIGLVRSQRWGTLHRFLSEPIEDRDGTNSKRVVEELFLWSWEGGENDHWRTLEGLEKHKTALSDHLCTLFVEWGKSFVGIVPDFEQLYETWEILSSLTHIEAYDLKDIKSAMPGDNRHIWTPMGRSAWHHETRKRILEHIQTDGNKQSLLTAGFGGGQQEFLEAAISFFERTAKRIVWY